jgi:hypothetical protein
VKKLPKLIQIYQSVSVLVCLCHQHTSLPEGQGTEEKKTIIGQTTYKMSRDSNSTHYYQHVANSQRISVLACWPMMIHN